MKYYYCRRQKLILLVSIFLVLGVNACSSNSTPTERTTDASSVPEVQKTTSVITSTPEVFLSPEPILTITVIPTLSPEEATAKTLDLLEDNAGCQLPCWWGIKPGTTSWREALDFFQSFATGIYIPGTMNAPASFAEFRFSVPEEISPVFGQLSMMVMRLNDKLAAIRVADFDLPDYQLVPFMNKYGPPSEIWIHTLRGTQGGPRAFIAFFVYPDNGILAAFSSWGELRDNRISACFTKSGGLYLWPGNDVMGLDSALELFGTDIIQKPYLSIEDATEITVQDFYNLYSDSLNPVCLETPAELWP